MVNIINYNIMSVFVFNETIDVGTLVGLYVIMYNNCIVYIVLNCNIQNACYYCEK